MNGYAKVCAFLDKCMRIVSTTTLVLIFAVITANTFLRYLFKINLLWSYDVCRVLFMFYVFTCAAMVYRMGKHIKFVFLEMLYPKAFERIVRIVFHLVEFIVFFIIARYGAVLAYNSRNQTLPASGLSAMLFYVPLVIASIVCIFFMVEFMLEELAGLKREDVLVSEEDGGIA